MVQTLLVDDRFIYPPKRSKIVMLMDLGHFSYHIVAIEIISLYHYIIMLSFLPSVTRSPAAANAPTGLNSIDENII